MLWLPLIAALAAPGDAAAQPIANWHMIAVIDISAKGEILSCTDETEGGRPIGIGDPCKSFTGDVPRQMLEGLGGPGVARRVTIEMAMAVGEARPMLRFHQPSQRPNARATAIFDISAEGSVEHCRRLETGEEGWTATLPSLCSVVPGPYRPAVDARGRPRRSVATFTIAFSTARD